MSTTEAPATKPEELTTVISEKQIPSSPDLEDDRDPNARPECFSSTLSEVLFVLTVTMAIAMSSFLTGGITVVTSYIGEDLGVTGAPITWLSAAPNLACGSFLLFFGRVADLFGRKTLFVGSLFLFSIFSVVAGFVKTGISLDIIVGIMGLFSASAVPAAVGSLGMVYEKPSRRKNIAFATFSAGNPLGFVFGTFASGVATQLFSWRANFYFLAMVYGVFTLVAVFTMPSEEAQKSFNWDTVKSFDILGTVLTVGGIGMISAALTTSADAPEGWKTPYIIVLLILGVLLLITFVWWETKCEAPLMPTWIWRDRDFTLLNTIQALGFAGFSSSAFWITLFFQRYWSSSPITVAVYVLPLAIMGLTVNVVIGLIMHRVSNKLLLGVGAACYTVSFLLLALNKTTASYWAFCFPSFILCVWGADITFNVSNMYVMSTLPRNQQSVAGGIFQCVIRLCSTLSLAISTAIFEAVQDQSSSGGYYGGDPALPYAATFWFSMGISALSIVFVPFVKVRTQGHS